MARKVNADTVVYVASSWWQFSDPNFYVVALSLKRVESEVRKHIKEEARSARDDGSYKTISAATDDIYWSGVFPERLGDYASGRELDEAIDELKSGGVWYPNPP